MRLFRVLSTLSLLFGARASSLGSRQSDAHPLDARDVSDVCAMLDPSPATEENLFLALIDASLYGQFDVSLSQPISSVLSVMIGTCLCVSQVSQYAGDPNLAFLGIDATDLANFVRRMVNSSLEFT